MLPFGAAALVPKSSFSGIYGVQPATSGKTSAKANGNRMGSNRRRYKRRRSGALARAATRNRDGSAAITLADIVSKPAFLISHPIAFGDDEELRHVAVLANGGRHGRRHRPRDRRLHRRHAEHRRRRVDRRRQSAQTAAARRELRMGDMAAATMPAGEMRAAACPREVGVGDVPAAAEMPGRRRCATAETASGAPPAEIPCRRDAATAMRQRRTTGNSRHGGDPRGAKARRHRRIAIGDAAAMRRIVDPGVAGKGSMGIDRSITPTIDAELAVLPVDRSPAPERPERRKLDRRIETDFVARL